MENDDELEDADGAGEAQDRDVQPLDASEPSWLVMVPFMMMVFMLSGLWALGGISAELWASLVVAMIVVGRIVARAYKKPFQRDDERRMCPEQGAAPPRADALCDLDAETDPRAAEGHAGHAAGRRARPASRTSPP